MKTITQTKKISDGTQSADIDLWLMGKINDGWEISIATPKMITLVKRVSDAEYQTYYNQIAAAHSRWLNTSVD